MHGGCAHRYFYNEITGDRQWTRPDPPLKNKSGGPAANGQIPPPPDLNGGADSDSDGGGASPLDVLENLRRTNGARGESEDEVDYDDDEEEETGDEAAAGKTAAGLGPHVREPGGGASGSGGGDGKARPPVTSPRDPRRAAATRAVAAGGAGGKGGKGKLPPGWEVVERANPGTSTQKTYYFHRATGRRVVSGWHRPLPPPGCLVDWRSTKVWACG